MDAISVLAGMASAETQVFLCIIKQKNNSNK